MNVYIDVIPAFDGDGDAGGGGGGDRRGHEGGRQQEELQRRCRCWHVQAMTSQIRSGTAGVAIPNQMADRVPP